MDQHPHTWYGWLNHHWAFISLVCFPAFMCYLNSVAIFFKVMGATQLADFLAKLEDALTASVNAVKTYKKQATTTLVIILALPMVTGCASAGMNGFCGRITGTEITIPYVGGKGNADGYICHVGCVGINCPKPDYDAITKIMTTYLNAQTTDGKLTVSGPGTVSFTPTR